MRFLSAQRQYAVRPFFAYTITAFHGAGVPAERKALASSSPFLGTRPSVMAMAGILKGFLRARVARLTRTISLAAQSCAIGHKQSEQVGMYPKSRELAREGAATLEFLLNGRTVIAETVEAHETLLDYLVPNCAAMPGLFRGRLGRLAHVAV